MSLISYTGILYPMYHVCGPTGMHDLGSMFKRVYPTCTFNTQVQAKGFTLNFCCSMRTSYSK